MEYPCYLNDFNSKLNFRKYFESDLANELGCLIHPKDGKKYVMKIFELFTDYIDNQFEINNILYDELSNLINVYCDTIYNNLNQLIEDYCINKDTIIDFDYINSLNIIIQFINLNHNLINNIEITTNNYYDIVFKLKKYDSFNLYIDKLKKSK